LIALLSSAGCACSAGCCRFLSMTAHMVSTVHPGTALALALCTYYLLLLLLLQVPGCRPERSIFQPTLLRTV
jgi:hypothetical protein